MRRITLALSFAALAGCAAHPVTDADVAAVLRSVADAERPSGPVILMAVTDTAGLATSRRDAFEQELMRDVAPEVREAVEDLSRRSRRVVSLPDALAISAHDRRMTEDSVRALLRESEHPRDYRFPGRASVYLISAPGFSRDGTLAVVRIEQVCGYLCGGITLRAVRRHPGGWLPAEEVWSAVF